MSNWQSKQQQKKQRSSPQADRIKQRKKFKGAKQQKQQQERNGEQCTSGEAAAGVERSSSSSRKRSRGAATAEEVVRWEQELRRQPLLSPTYLGIYVWHLTHFVMAFLLPRAASAAVDDNADAVDAAANDNDFVDPIKIPGSCT